MKILIVCRLNQARSIITSSFVRKHFPGAIVTSAGVQAVTGSPIPKLILDTATQWNLQVEEESSINIRDVRHQEMWDLIICSDNGVARQVEILGVPAREMFYLTEFADHQSLIARDPVGMSAEETKTELAKAILLTSRALTQIVEHKHSNLYSIYFDGMSTPTRKMQTIGSFEQHNILIDCQLRYPDYNCWESLKLPLRYFTMKSDIQKIENHENSGVMVCGEDDLNENRIYLSSRWRNFVSHHAPRQTILIPNMTISSPDTYYLSMIWSRQGVRG
jgi:protein-tyrosine-phosphatase